METSPASVVPIRPIITPIPATGSPMVIINGLENPVLITISGGTVTTISVSPDGTNFLLAGLLAGVFLLYPDWAIRIVYLLAPTINQIG